MTKIFWNILLLLFLSANYAFSQKTIKIEKSDYSVQEFIKEIETKTKLAFIYSTNKIPFSRKVLIDKGTYNLNELLKTFFSQINIDFLINSKTIAIKPSKVIVQEKDVISITNKKNFSERYKEIINTEKDSTTKPQAIHFETIQKLISKKNISIQPSPIYSNLKYIQKNSQSSKVNHDTKLNNVDFHSNSPLKIINNREVLNFMDICSKKSEVFDQDSIFDNHLTLKTFNNENINISIGNIFSSGIMQTPLFKKQGELFVSAKYNYKDLFAENITGQVSKKMTSNDGDFIEFYANYSHNLSKNQKLNALVYYFNNDDLKMNHSSYFPYWRNILSILSWEYKYNKNTQIKSDISIYSFNVFPNTWNNQHEYSLKSFENQNIFKQSISKSLSYSIVGSIKYRKIESISENIFKNNSLQPEIQAKGTWNNRYFSTKSELKLNSYMQLGGYKDVDGSYNSSTKIMKTYNNFDYLLGISKSFKNISFEVNYQKKTEFIQHTTNTETTIPLEIWLPSSKQIRPRQQVEISANSILNISKIGLKARFDGGFRSYQNQIDLKNSFHLHNASSLNEQIASGKAKEYFMKVNIMEAFGKFQFNFQYEYLDILYDIPEISTSSYTPNLSYSDIIFSSIDYKISESSNIFIHFSFKSKLNFKIDKEDEEPKHSGPNSLDRIVEIPNFQSLDIGYEKQLKLFKKNEGKICFKINNIYDRKNVRTIFYNENKPKEYTENRIYVSGIFPEINFTIKF